MLKRFVFLILAILLICVMAACGSSTTSQEQPSGAKTNEKMTIKHELGTAKVMKKPKTIVSFDFGTTDTLDALGIDIKALPKKTVPSYLSKYQDNNFVNVGDMFEPDFEKIHELKPDVIFISGRTAEAYKQLNDIAPTVNMSINTKHYMDSFTKNAQTIGQLFNKEDAVNQQLEGINQSIQRLKEKTKGQTALFIISTGGKISAFGSGSRYGLLYDVFGFEPIDKHLKASTHGQKISFEYIAQKDPDYLFVLDRDQAIQEKHAKPAKEVVENGLVKKAKAYKNHHIVYVKPDVWYLSGGGLASMQAMIKDVEESIE